jgi:hypothetical protein
MGYIDMGKLGNRFMVGAFWEKIVDGQPMAVIEVCPS